jgi:hypothetical protein
MEWVLIKMRKSANTADFRVKLIYCVGLEIDHEAGRSMLDFGAFACLEEADG